MNKKLVIAEKPSVAKDYAYALNSRDFKDGYIEGSEYIITWGFGHLFTLAEPGEYDEKYKAWNIEDLPIIPEKFKIKLIDDPGVKKQFNIIKSLIERQDVESIILGGDAGREGELIGRYILMGAKNEKAVYRVWLSSLTYDDIKTGFHKIEPSSKFDNIFYSAQARAESDWLIGMNLSRAYTKKYAKGLIFSIGRCQTSVLAEIVKRDAEIESFNPSKYYEVKCNFSGYDGLYVKDNSSKIESGDEAERICKEVSNLKTGTIREIKKETKNKPHPLLYNLTNLQRALNKKYGYTAKQVLDTMQDLYEKHKILSYPRTSSRYITESMVPELPKIIENLKFGKFKDAVSYCLSLDKLPVNKRLADNSMVSDHTAIIPTNNKNIEKIYDGLNDKEKDVFDEVAAVFLSAFYGDYVYESTIIYTQAGDNMFISKGIKTLSQGWKEIYKSEEEEEEEGSKLSINFEEGDKVDILKVETVEKKTSPPSRYNENLLLKMMENPSGIIEEESLKQAIKGHGIGTDATRAEIIETLIKRQYVKREKKSIISTEIGRKLIKCIDNEMMKKPELTAIWEEKLQKIADGEIKKSEFMNETVDFVKDEINRIKSIDECEIIEKAKAESLGKCPLCEGEIRKNKAGYGCSRWKEGCKFFISAEIAGKKITETQVKKLLTKGTTDIIKGFKSKKGKNFNAALEFDKVSGKVNFKF